MKKVVLVVNDLSDLGQSYHGPFSFLGPCSYEMNLLDSDPDRVAAVVFTGGADISPCIYKQSKGMHTRSDARRDLQEMDAFIKAVRAKLPIIGICRGAQLLCALTGGTLIQHVSMHSGNQHRCKLKNGKSIGVNSYHHQMMVPGPEAEILGWAEPRLSSIYLGGSDESLIPPEKEAEIVYFYRQRAMGFQYHPENMPPHSDGVKICRELVERYLDL
jgi:putative glutamine amidotransferase